MSLYPPGNPLEEARLLLPWYITGKLSEPEKKLVELMFEQHPELHEEYVRELNLVGLIRDNNSLLHLTAVDTTQHRLDKLMKRIARDEVPKEGTEEVVGATLIPTRKPFRLGAFLQGLIPDIKWLTPAGAVFASLLAVQVGFIGWYVHAMTSKSASENIYLSASVAEGKAAMPLVNGMVLLVDFNGEATFHQVRDFLLHWNARVVDGPVSGNLLKIEVKDVKPSDQRSDVILQQMQQDQKVIAFIGREF
jgi:anti-sigma factor RsiW